MPITTPTQIQLQTGLGGAIGCDFSTSNNQLVFVEYDTGKLSSLTVAPATPAYKVLGTGYTNPEDVRLSADGVHAYVTERSGDLVRVALSSANRGAATVIASGMTVPQQLFLDEAHNAAYVVEYASPGSLLKINLTSGAKTVITGALTNPVGVVLSSDLQYAYVSEQTAPTGRISRIQLSTGLRTTVATGLTNPFFLAWADPAQDSLFVPERDPANSIVNVNISSGATNVVVSGVPTRPSCLAAPYIGQMYICSDSVIESATFVGFAATGPLLMGIGLIPFNYVNGTTGLATTPATSPYQVTNAPFGGTLGIMVDFQAAASAGAAYYQVLVDSIVQMDTWTTYEWSGSAWVLISVAPATVGSAKGCFPVHLAAQLFNYQPPALGYEFDSTAVANGLRKIQIQLINSAGAILSISPILQIMVNNQSCVATLQPPVLNSTPPQTADPTCGVLNYNKNTALTVSLGFTASQPANFATYSVALARGATSVGPPPTLPGGTVPPATTASPITATVANLLGPCPTAGFALELYVYAAMTNGWSRQSQYDAEALEGFVLTTS